MLAAVEIYNKPAFGCKQEIYAILAISAWEYLLIAKVIKEFGINAAKRNSKRQSTEVKGWKESLNVLKSRQNADTQPPKEVSQNLEQLSKIRNYCCHGNLNRNAIETISPYALACFHNFIKLYKKWFGSEDITQAGLDIFPIFYHFPDLEEQKHMSADLTELVNLLKKEKYDKNSEYHVHIPCKLTLVPGNSNDTNVISSRIDPNNPEAIPVKEDTAAIKGRYPNIYRDVYSAAKKLYGKPIPKDLWSRIFNALKTNCQCATSRQKDLTKPQNAKNNVKYYYNLSECEKEINRMLPTNS